MTVYLSSPNTQQQAEHVCEMPVLLSFALYSNWLDRYQASFGRILIDSGAYSELTSNTSVDVIKYKDWAEKWEQRADAIAGLDDIRGDWRRSLKNYELLGFPTFHDSDPYELLDDLIPIARKRGGWIGIGLIPPRTGKERWIRETCDRIPDDIHIHGWALRAYTYIARIDSVDSTNWFRDAMDINKIPLLRHLTYGECLDVVVKRYQRESRQIIDRTELTLFDFK
jgi:hypothetical protein